MPKALYCHAQLEGKRVPLRVGGQAYLTYPAGLWMEILPTCRTEPIGESAPEHPTCTRFDHSCPPPYSANTVRPAGALAGGSTCLTPHKAKRVFTFSS